MPKILLVIAFGLVSGSFLTCLKNRLDDLGSILVGRSKCPRCKHTLVFFDLFPVFSFLFLWGKCRHCKAKISLEYPIIELVTVLITYLVYYYFGISLVSVLILISLYLSIVASAVDITDQEVHFYLLVAGIISAVIFRLVLDPTLLGLGNLILAMISAAIIPFAFFVISHEKWMGLGDTFFALWLGALCGYPKALAGIMIAFFSGAIFGIIFLLNKKGSKKRIAVPFGPFIAFGGMVALIFGNEIIAFYLKLLGF